MPAAVGKRAGRAERTHLAPGGVNVQSHHAPTECIRAKWRGVVAVANHASSPSTPHCRARGPQRRSSAARRREDNLHNTMQLLQFHLQPLSIPFPTPSPAWSSGSSSHVVSPQDRDSAPDRRTRRPMAPSCPFPWTFPCTISTSQRLTSVLP
jgi:hypothetical protein